MRSPADRNGPVTARTGSAGAALVAALRADLERALRVTSFVLLAFCAWALTTVGRPDGRTVARDDALDGELPQWTRQSRADTITLRLTRVPSAVQRDWLRALASAGAPVLWSGSAVATAIEVLPIPDPAGGFVVLSAAPRAAWVSLSDSLGVIDSARVTSGGAVFRAAAHTGPLRMMAAGQPARAAATDTLLARHAVVLGGAGWETRFVVNALEERGWTVDARVAVSPGIAVTQGRPLPLDTARHAVVIAIDSLAAADAAAIARFVGSGGGAVLSPAAAATAPSVAAGRVGPHLRAPMLVFTAAAPRGALALDPVLPRADAIILERQRGHVVLAARRVGAGRVVQSGYDETWRWRMAGIGDAVDAHRGWWADAVAAAAYRSETVNTGNGGSGVGNDRAPLASLVAALGPARPAATTARASIPDLRALLLPAALLLFLSLTVEWASRRLRGAA